jgi:glycosyltransferase involved in cell wall biosynthesis
MSNIKVSVCCTCYNQEKYIRQCLEGFVMQITNFDFEILVHDDASTDDTIKILKEYELNYPKLLRCIYQEENQFGKKNVFTGFLLPQSKGKYIALCEGDDYWTDPYKLQKQIDLLDSTNSDFCYSDFSVYFQESAVLKNRIFASNLAKINIDSPLLSYGFLGVPTWIVRRDYLLGYNPDVYKILDKNLFLLIDLLRKKKKIVYLDEDTAVYRRNLNSDSNKEDAYLRFTHHKLSFEFMLDYYLQYYNDDEQIRTKINMLSINILSEAHDHLDFELINRIKLFLLESNIDITQILNKFKDRDKYKKNFESLENSKLRKIIKIIKR